MSWDANEEKLIAFSAKRAQSQCYTIGIIIFNFEKSFAACYAMCGGNLRGVDTMMLNDSF